MNTSPVWRLHVVRLGNPRHPEPQQKALAVGYRHDWMARHWWCDVAYWRVCLIRRHVARRWGLL